MRNEGRTHRRAETMELVGMPSPTISYHVASPNKSVHRPVLDLDRTRPNTTKISPPRLLRKKKS